MIISLSNKYLNIGCGSRFNRDWVNIDIQPMDNSITPYDILNGLSFDDDYFDVVYHSHIIEHIQKNKAQDFFDDCYRVLKAGGIMRVVAPDLEQIAKTYLCCLQNAYEDMPGWDENYDWIMLEMYDQIVREKSGGEMLKYLSRKNISNSDFILGRCGFEVYPEHNSAKDEKNHAIKNKGMILARIKNWLDSFTRKGAARDWFVEFMLGEEFNDYANYRENTAFRKSGELHRWMYDRYSLSRLLVNSGFKNIHIFEATDSYIQDWYKQGLDTDESGKTYKPDSIFIEGIKVTK